MQHVFSFTLAEACAFLIYAAGAAAGLYAGGDTLDNAATVPDDEPETNGVPLQRLCIIGEVQTVTATLIGPASAGDSMELWGMSKTEGDEYFARYTN